MDGFERADVKDSGDLDVYSVEEVWALVRAAGSLTDAAIFLRRPCAAAPLGDPRAALAGGPV